MYNFFEKLIHSYYYPTRLYPNIKSAVFPKFPIPKFRILARLRGVKSELNHRNISHNLGSLYSLPHKFANKIYAGFLSQNPNHLGNWSTKAPNYTTLQLEYEVIQKLIRLYGAQEKDIEGYITTGGTEGNIFTTWLGRTYLEQYVAPNQLCILYTNLTHYSIRKAAIICRIPHHIVALDDKTWSIHERDLYTSVMSLYTKGIRGFLIPLTRGYTLTGSSDDITLITNTISKITNIHKDIKFFLWVDAAFNGLVEPFQSQIFLPLSSPFIQAFIVDFHKFGQVSYPSGVILYQKKLRKLIEKPTGYLEEKDNTLLGSRTGIPAVSIWGMIHLLGINGYKKTVQTQMTNKELFIKQIKNILPKSEIITHNNSLACGIIFHSLSKQRLPENIESKYWLHASQTDLIFYPNLKRRVTIYKIFFLPHIKLKIITEFIQDLQKQIKLNQDLLF